MFDNLSLISSFTGPDENPLSEGGDWANPNTTGNVFQRISNTAGGAGAGDAFACWTPSNYGPDVQAYITISTVGTTGITLRITGEGALNTWDGYHTLATSTLSRIYRVDNAARTQLVTTSAVTWGVGDLLGMIVRGAQLELWRFPSGGSAWAVVITTTDATYSSAGKIGMYTSGTTGKLDDFHAGPIVYVSDDPAIGFSGRGAGW